MGKDLCELTVLTEVTDRPFSFFLLLDLLKKFPEMNEESRYLNLKGPITTAADDKFFNIFLNFRKNKITYFMRIVCQQTILMNIIPYLLFLKKRQNVKLLSAANYRWRFMGLVSYLT